MTFWLILVTFYALGSTVLCACYMHLTDRAINVLKALVAQWDAEHPPSIPSNARPRDLVVLGNSVFAVYRLNEQKDEMRH